jgi:hypothetical protein
MRSTVLTAFRDFTIKHEGFTPFMYLDIKGLVTTGIGNLVDYQSAGTNAGYEEALSLPWKRPDGSLASKAEIGDAWRTVKSHQEMRNGGGMAYAKLTDIRLDREAVFDLVSHKLAQVETTLRERFHAWEAWPADAQLATLSMAWAMGAWFNFPKFTVAVNRIPPDFESAAVESHISNGTKARNDANAEMFRNAAAVLRDNGDPDDLRYCVEVPRAAQPVVVGPQQWHAPTLKPASVWPVAIAALLAAGAGYMVWTKGHV